MSQFVCVWACVVLRTVLPYFIVFVIAMCGLVLAIRSVVAIAGAFGI